jgi:hypothetical protein
MQPATNHSAQKPTAELLHGFGKLLTSLAREMMALCIACECGNRQA